MKHTRAKPLDRCLLGLLIPIYILLEKSADLVEKITLFSPLVFHLFSF
ncbi:MAG: hypothetical protein CLLPBCKN_000328 [Chroococcidiopsis cubana SAG 39.79]|nr:hypothetical protein [Chroococcidiopsis cubana SAG 39.79]